MSVNLSKRAYDHSFHLDPILRSRLDNDFYKLLMQQVIFLSPDLRDVQVEFVIRCRTKDVVLGRSLDVNELRRQLAHAETVPYGKTELLYLAGNTFYGKRGIFRPEFIEWLGTSMLPAPHIVELPDGDIEVKFSGRYLDVMAWEIPGLFIVNELRTRAGLATMSEDDLDVFYARGLTKLYGKLERMRGVPGLKVSEFGTRRRHSHLWQERVIRLMKSTLGEAFAGTSNVYFAMKYNLEAIGTNAHELPMVFAALADGAGGRPRSDEALKQSQYEVLRRWNLVYDGALRVILPDTFGTTQFLADAPDFVVESTGARFDSKEPFAAGHEYLDWVRARGGDPRTKLALFSDGLDVGDILKLHAEFAGHRRFHDDHLGPHRYWDAEAFDENEWVYEPKCRVAFGWGTMASNDFIGCHPDPAQDHLFKPISLVCKVAIVEGRYACKLSDNYAKATGPAGTIERYRRVFGTAGVANVPVVV